MAQHFFDWLKPLWVAARKIRLIYNFELGKPFYAAFPSVSSFPTTEAKVCTQSLGVLDLNNYNWINPQAFVIWANPLNLGILIPSNSLLSLLYWTTSMKLPMMDSNRLATSLVLVALNGVQSLKWNKFFWFIQPSYHPKQHKWGFFLNLETQSKVRLAWSLGSKTVICRVPHRQPRRRDWEKRFS